MYEKTPDGAENQFLGYVIDSEDKVVKVPSSVGEGPIGSSSTSSAFE